MNTLFKYSQLILLFVSLFLYTFAPRIANFGGLNLGFFPIVLFTLFNWNKLRAFFKSRFVWNFILALAIIFTYCLVITFVYKQEITHYLRLCMVSFISLLSGFMVFNWLNKTFVIETDKVEAISFFLKIIIGVTLLNSLIVIIEAVNIPLRREIETYLYNDPNSTVSYIDHPFRIRGLAATGGASLSMFSAFVVAVSGVLTRLNKLKFGTLIMVVITVSQIFIGRTGLIISLFLLIYHLIIGVSHIKISFKFFMMFLIYIGLYFITINSLNKLEYSEEGIEWAFEWLNGIENKKVETKSTDDLQEMLYFPDNPIHVLFGIGFFEGTNEYYPRTDSGYLKTLLSVGVLMGLFIYSLFLNIFILLGKWNHVLKKVFWLLLPVFLFVEVKEPFLYQNYFSRVLFILLGGYVFYIMHDNKSNQCVE